MSIAFWAFIGCGLGALSAALLTRSFFDWLGQTLATPAKKQADRDALLNAVTTPDGSAA